MQNASVAKYGFAVSFDVRHCQPVKVAGNVCVAGSGGVHVPWDASRLAADWSPMSVRQKFAANALVMLLLTPVPSVR